MFWPPENVTFFHSKLLLYNCKFHNTNIKDDQLDIITSLILHMLTMQTSLRLTSSKETVSSNQCLCCCTWLNFSRPKTKLQNVGAGDPSLTILIDHGSHAVLPTIDRLQLGWLTRGVDPAVGRFWPRQAGEDRRVALATSSSRGFRRMPTHYCSYLRCGGLRLLGVTERRNGSLGLRDDDDDDDDDLVSKMEVKTNFSSHLQAVRNRDCWAFENHWRIFTVWCRGRPKMHFSFSAVNENAVENEIPFSAENESHLCLYHRT